MAKNYRLHCFGCGLKFHSKKDVHRKNGNPYCEECYGDILSSEVDAEIWAYEDEKMAREYREARKRYEVHIKEWREKRDKIVQEYKKKGERIPDVLWTNLYNNMPSEPLTMEKKQLRNYYINKYGEW